MEKHTALNSQPEKYLDLCIRWRPKSENLLGHLALEQNWGVIWWEMLARAPSFTRISGDRKVASVHFYGRG